MAAASILGVFSKAAVASDQKPGGIVAFKEVPVPVSDDGNNVGFYMFIADKAKDLSSGTLYAAKWHQKDDKNGGNADFRSRWQLQKGLYLDFHNRWS